MSRNTGDSPKQRRSNDKQDKVASGAKGDKRTDNDVNISCTKSAH